MGIMLGKKLRKLRMEKGLSQMQLASLVNTTQDTVSLWELEKRVPSIESLVGLCKLFHVSADYLIGLEDEIGQKIY